MSDQSPAPAHTAAVLQERELGGYHPSLSDHVNAAATAMAGGDGAPALDPRPAVRSAFEAQAVAERGEARSPSPLMDHDVWLRDMLNSVPAAGVAPAGGAPEAEAHGPPGGRRGLNPEAATFSGGSGGGGGGGGGGGARGPSWDGGQGQGPGGCRLGFQPALFGAGAACPQRSSRGGGGGGGAVLSPDGKPYSKWFSVVEFKRHRIRKYESPDDVQTGQYVLVDGDRGQDCGLVIQTIRMKKDGTSHVHNIDEECAPSAGLKVEPGRVIRASTPEEVNELHTTLANDEQEALNKCRGFCSKLGLSDISVIDCELQFDRKKISFFFDSSHAVDFRELVRELYRMFNARIWMVNVNPRVKNVVPAGALSGVQKEGLSETTATADEEAIHGRDRGGGRHGNTADRRRHR